ncbi:class I SAM-dependent methyltransferase [Roseibium sp. RKSG952]|uniref:class I SAM-dependent methyltransferase n=1 Tax=Roseibium sp. RKSG952 TaxID=2529384 RepID=UPI0012BCFFF5|nr:class I SAM-dependent methyltransferase [Roseibium sp. RKSG952]MTH97967.1 class I SAM-dependent methyltransferase [Roseibium sp. RKSG952]
MTETLTRNEDAVRRTSNKHGVTIQELNRVSRDFIKASAQATLPVMDMGCAYGVATLPVLEKRKHVIACDLNPEHLDVLREKTPPEFQPYLTTQPGKFPQDFDFPPNSLEAILCSYVLHFLTGEDLVIALAKLRNWLVPGGRLFANVVSPMFYSFAGFAAEYDRRKATETWPGIMDKETIRKHIAPGYLEWIGEDAMFDFCHAFDKEFFARTLEDAGFTVEEAFYYNIFAGEANRHIFGPDGYPGCVGAIARA